MCKQTHEVLKRIIFFPIWQSSLLAATQQFLDYTLVLIKIMFFTDAFLFLKSSLSAVISFLLESIENEFSALPR